MQTNPTIDFMLNRKSIRKYKSEPPSDDILEAIVRAGQQAPFAYQTCSLIFCRESKKHPYKAPWMFTLCVDSLKFEKIMAKRGWKMTMNNLAYLLLALQDAAYVAENMVIAADSLGLGSCFIGAAPFEAEKIAEEYDLPKRVFPLVQLVMGYPDENPPPRPRFPLDYFLFEGKYPEFSEDQINTAIKVMDEGYKSQDYYKAINFMIPLDGVKEEKYDFETYSWTEHISRKLGLWLADPNSILEQMKKRGFEIPA
jgi:nitroreductase